MGEAGPIIRWIYRQQILLPTTNQKPSPILDGYRFILQMIHVHVREDRSCNVQPCAGERMHV